MATHDALRRSLRYKLKLILSENKILIQTIEEHIKRAEDVYRDTECLEKIPTSVFKQAMSRLETAYSACIKLILLASDLFESDTSNSGERTEALRSNTNKLIDDESSEPMRTLDNETLRRLCSLERKFQAYVAIRGQEVDKEMMQDLPAAGLCLATDGHYKRRMCGAEGTDVCFPPDPVTELNRFLFGLDCQNYDGYRDPRIILSNERKKFPREAISEATRNPPIHGPQSPTRTPMSRADGDNVGGVDFYINDIGKNRENKETRPSNYEINSERVDEDMYLINHKGPRSISSPEYKSRFKDKCNKRSSFNTLNPSPCAKEESNSETGVLLNSPGDLEIKLPRIGQRSWRRDNDTCRSLVEAASEKLTQALDELDNLPLYWLKRSQGIPSPPSPPPPTSEVCRSSVTGKAQRGLEKDISPICESVRHDNSDLIMPSYFSHDRTQCDAANMVVHCQEYGKSDTGLCLTQPVYQGGEFSLQAYFPPRQYKMSMDSEDFQKVFSPTKLSCPRFTGLSPEKPLELSKEEKFRGGNFRRHCTSPQKFIAPFECADPPPLIKKHPSYQQLLPAESHRDKKEKQLNVDCVHHILWRISNLERLLEHEISAEKGLLTQCLTEIQKLLSCCFVEKEQRREPGGIQHEDKKKSKHEKSILKKTEIKDTSLSSDARTTPEFDTEIAQAKFCDLRHQELRDEDLLQQLMDSKDSRKWGTQVETKKMVPKKRRKQPAKKPAVNKVREKEIRACFEDALATLGFERKDPSGMVEDYAFEKFQCGPLSKVVTTTSCSSTNAWEDSMSSAHVTQQEKSLIQGKVGRGKSRETGKQDKDATKNISGAGEEEICSTSESIKLQLQKSLKSSIHPKCLSAKRALSPTEEEKLNRNAGKAQSVKLQSMIEKLNAYLLKVSEIATNLDRSNTAGRADQDTMHTQGNDIHPTMGQSLIEKGTNTPQKFIKETVASEGVKNQGEKGVTSQENITTQTSNQDKCSEIRGDEPPLANEDNLKVSFQQVDLGRSNITPHWFTVAASPKLPPSSLAMLPEYPSPSVEVMNQTSLPQQMQNEPELHHILQPGDYLQCVPGVTNSPHIQAGSVLESEFHRTPIQDANLTQKQRYFEENKQVSDSVLTQLDLEIQSALQQASCYTGRNLVEENNAIHQQYTPLHSVVQVIERGDAVAENINPQIVGPSLQLYSNYICEGHGERDNLTSPTHSQFNPHYEHQCLPMFTNHGVCQQLGDSEQISQSPKHRDQLYQTVPWPEQHQQRCHQLQTPQESIFYQDDPGKPSCPENFGLPQNEYWPTAQQLPHLQQHQLQNNAPQHQMNKTNPQQQSSMPTMCHQQKIQPSPNVDPPSSCPTVALAPVSFEATPSDQPTFHRNSPSLACPQIFNPMNSTSTPFPAGGLNSFHASRSRSMVRFLSNQFDSIGPAPSAHANDLGTGTHFPPSITENVQTKLNEDSGTTRKVAGARRAVSQGFSARSRAEDRTVCLTNLPHHLAEMDLLKTLNQHGFVSKIYFIKHRSTGHFQGTAYVKYRECREAESAVTSLDGLELEGQKISATLMSKQSPKNLS